MTPTCYHGAVYRGGNDYRVIAHDKESGERYPLPHVKRHSPTGMSWGYAGFRPRRPRPLTADRRARPGRRVPAMQRDRVRGMDCQLG